MKKQLTKVNEKNNNVELVLRRYAEIPIEDLYKELNTSIDGIKHKEIEEKTDEYGKNIITFGRKNTKFHRFFTAIINPFNIILLIIATVTYIFDVILSSKPDYLTVSIIVFLVLLSSTVAFIQGEKSNTAVTKLTKMISNKADIRRNGKMIEVLIEDILPGDIIKLSAGDLIPADVRFITTKDTFVAQSALTGESNPVEKFSEITDKRDKTITDITNIGFMGSNIVSGSSFAVVLTTGNNTYFGSMAQTLNQRREKNSFEKGVSSVSELLIRMMIIMMPVVLLINGITKHDWLQAILFSISVAVGLTPEMLPVIMTSTLAKGAVSMSKHQVIVKDLGSIQTFGQMDILCTDKTGTLTEDKIILEKYMNVHGQDDYRVLRHAYLNSYFQTGLKNLIDIAIIERATKKEIHEIKDKYHRVDEIPFDFTRRRMSVVLEDNTGKRQLITKGAVEEILAISSFLEIDGKVVPLDQETRKIATETYEKFNSDGLRMIGVAQKNEVPGSNVFGVKDESNMVLIGFIGFLDPPKESAKEAIKALKEHGVRVIVLTGDSEGVALKVCNKVGLETEITLLGIDVEKMSDEELKIQMKKCNLFSKLSPNQKKRIVKLYQEEGHTVGFMGDGINDAPALKQADVGISVDTAVDIAKETADIILLKKDLMVLEEGVIEGRKTFGNINKYIKMAVSGNFGNMISVIIASIFLPFLPMLPVQILTQNILNDFSQLGIPFDTVDKEYLEKPRKWHTKSIKRFMIWFGPLSSIFDILTFAILWFIIKANTTDLAPLFQAGWFVFGTISQILIIQVIRTRKIPFIQSNASKSLIISSLIILIVTLVIGFTKLAVTIDMAMLPIKYLPWLLAVLIGYLVLTQIMKKIYMKKYGEWL
ncbi:magnesium-translocating P-type ATPase [Haploplasma axanthum]|uniref:Magnesium-transporting ATPase, P-type 1 n=1 Tax=Haploplasma axanthum TaxID=29552 RepID=A0A449BE41_HAPAX|nr:magnesium-translocating P-type ATPase [Haploplasma axanthum]VEU80698.1 Magnesium-transporting ATPase, P-type 1 [Haploplasma axanthum]